MIEAAKFKQVIRNFKTDIETYFDSCIQDAVQHSRDIVLLPVVRSPWPEEQIKEVLQMYIEKGGWQDVNYPRKIYQNVYGALKPRDQDSQE